MRIRMKFSKRGSLKYIGHLDTMRYFQKAIRRAGLPAAFSGGYSPHMIMSFAAPLGVGIESRGEYFDLELAEELPCPEITERLNEVMAEGFTVVSTVRIGEEKSGNAMSLVAACDYQVEFRDGLAPENGWQERISAFLSQERIPVIKNTKKGEAEVDLRPRIYEMKLQEGGIFYRLASASSNYTKPELVTEAFCTYLGHEMDPYALMITRLEIYACEEKENSFLFIPLKDLGEEQ